MKHFLPEDNLNTRFWPKPLSNVWLENRYNCLSPLKICTISTAVADRKWKDTQINVKQPITGIKDKSEKNPERKLAYGEEEVWPFLYIWFQPQSFWGFPIALDILSSDRIDCVQICRRQKSVNGKFGKPRKVLAILSWTREHPGTWVSWWERIKHLPWSRWISIPLVEKKIT